MASADRRDVPLNAICSRKWATPFSASVSFLLPDPTQTPMAAEPMPGMCSVMTRNPFERVERRMVMRGRAP